MKILSENKCCGCGCCADICPKQCIQMVYNRDGFLVPSVDEQKCVHCDQCKMRCPALHPVTSNRIKAVYKANDKEIRSSQNMESTSGAVFSALANQVVSGGGYAVGAAFSDEYHNVEHIVCSTAEQIDLCRGSKYIQSQTKTIYQQVDRLLKSGQTVLFSGTPCQVAAMRAFVQNKSADNLFTVDFICHGVASTTYYQQFLDHISGGKTVSYVNFRNKKNGYARSHLVMKTADGTIKDEYFYEEPYFGKAFANNLIARPSCGSCRYATTERAADITLADNIQYANPDEKRAGSSLVFLNTEKGQQLFDSVKDKIDHAVLRQSEVEKSQLHLNHPAYPHRNRNRLLRTFNKRGFLPAVRYVSNYKMRRVDCLRELWKKVLRRLDNIRRGRFHAV